MGIFVIMGIALVYQALRIKLGYYRNVFLRQRGLSIPKYGYYGNLPLGIGLILAVLSTQIEESLLRDILFYIGMYGGFLVALLFMVLKPNFLKPRWLLDWEATYDQATIDYLFEQARLNAEDWTTFTPELFERWVQDVVRRYEEQQRREREADKQ